MDEITINGVEYVRKDTLHPPSGSRVVAVLTSGWVFAGDATVSEDGKRVTLTRAVQVRRWSGGIENVVKPGGHVGQGIYKMANDVDYPIHAELFRIPVDVDWGLTDA